MRDLRFGRNDDDARPVRAERRVEFLGQLLGSVDGDGVAAEAGRDRLDIDPRQVQAGYIGCLLQ